MTGEQGFLDDLKSIPWQPGHGFQPSAGVFIGQGISPLEVATARAQAVPNRANLSECWKARRGMRPTPVLLVVLHPKGAALCGATGEKPPVHLQLETAQVERLCRVLLEQPDRHAALRLLTQALSSLETELPGLVNEGLVSLHALTQRNWVAEKDWREAGRKAAKVAGRQDRELLTELGYQVEQLDSLTSLLSVGKKNTALAVLLLESEHPDAGTARFNDLSPVSYALAKADEKNLAWVLLVQGSRVRLYSTLPDTGVGRRGRTETWLECQPALLAGEQLPFFWLLFSADALKENGSFASVLEESGRFATDLARRLRERIHEQVMPLLTSGIAEQLQLQNPGREQLSETYQMALTVLFRLLCIAYAEDRDLLPYKSNDFYRRRSLKQKAQELAEHRAEGKPLAAGGTHWQEVKVLWEAVAEGNVELGVPAYGGALFSADETLSQVGAKLARLTPLPDTCFEPALSALLVAETAEKTLGPVDFRSLGVREFGTIYEGLLESELSLAETDLTLDKKDNYIPAKAGAPVVVRAGETYLHNRSGARKSSGSYYTKDFAVEHLLDGALEPALDAHLKRLDGLNDADATDAFLDFRVADLAVGSGHFLVAAIDRLEKRLAGYLARRSLPGVRNELISLREEALAQLDKGAEATLIEDGRLLRRMIARHCIYGVDFSPIAVQLSQLAVWIHTFVPGLPLSLLDHNLVHGNSLVGIGTMATLLDRFREATEDFPLKNINAENLLGEAKEPLARLARLNDATLADIAEARKAIREAEQAVARTRDLCDLMAAAPVSEDPRVAGFAFDEWESRLQDPDAEAIVRAARKSLQGLHPLHFPVAFPEVFLRAKPGFDVILGNPPWEKVKVDKDAFWTRYFPGLQGQPMAMQEAEITRLQEARPDLQHLYETEVAEQKRYRQVLMSSAYPGMGTGDPDLYKAFCWRFWRLTEAGRLGVVLPRGVLIAQGSTEFRRRVFGEAAEVEITTLTNNGGWVFDEVGQSSMCLVCIARNKKDEATETGSIRLSGPYDSLTALQEGRKQPPVSFQVEEVLTWTDSASLPNLPSSDSVAVFGQLRKAPRLDLKQEGQWRARPDTELHATNDKNLMDRDLEEYPDDHWRVYRGSSFNLWNPDTGDYYAHADPELVIEHLQRKRLRANRNARSAHAEFPLKHVQDRKTLPCFAPRLVFRDVSKTIIACLVPPKVFLTNKAPYFLWPHGNEKDQAFLLGLLCSIPLDWYARRFVELNLNFHIINPFPIPRLTTPRFLRQKVVELAGRLACPDARFADWAGAVGVAYGPLAESEKEDMLHQLDAAVAQLYGLDEAQLRHIFQTFRNSWDYQARLDGVLRHFHDFRRFAGR